MSQIQFGNNKGYSKMQITIMVLVAVFVVLFAVGSAVLLNGAGEKKIAVSDAESTPVNFVLEQGTVYNHAITDNKLFFFSADNIKIASATGALEEDMPLKASNPICSTDGNYTLIADRGGKTANIFSGAKLEKTLTLDENIVIAKINKNGYCLFITEGDVHKNSAIVRSATGEEIFKWKSGSLSVVSADISDNNRDIAISTMGTDGGIITSHVYMFNITKDKPFTNEPVENEIFGAMQFEGNYMYCIGSSKTYIYNSYGKCIDTIDYEERELIGYEINDGVVALLYSDSSKNSNGSMIRTYNSKGVLQGEFVMEEKAKFLDYKSGTIAVDNNRVISILDSKCREKFQLNLKTALNDFCFINGSSLAVGITATGAEIIEVRK